MAESNESLQKRDEPPITLARIILLAVIGLLCGAIYWYSHYGFHTDFRDIAVGPWKFVSIKGDEELNEANNVLLLEPGDGIAAIAPAGSDFCYVFVQDELEFENEASIPKERQVGGNLARVAGVKLSLGSGRVRMVALQSPVSVTNLSALLARVNEQVPKRRRRGANPDKMVDILKQAVNAEITPARAVFTTSSWYRLIPPKETGEIPSNAESGAPATRAANTSPP